MKIHNTLDVLDELLNRAIALRNKPSDAVTKGSLKSTQAETLAALNREIGDLMRTDIHSSEGSRLHETKLRSHLAFLAGDINQSYTAPTAADTEVYQDLGRQAEAGEQKLEAAIAAANKLLP